MEHLGHRSWVGIRRHIVLFADCLRYREDPLSWPLAAGFSVVAAVVDPGILLGVALLWTFLQTKIFLPIYGTIYLLMVAMVIKSMPFGTQMIKSVLLQLGNDLEEASKVCGGTWVDTFRRVLVPLTMPALITVGLVGFISAARDISTVVLLGSGKSRTLSLLMLDFAAGAEFEKATVVAVIIVGLVVGAALFARMLGGQVGVRVGAV